MSAAHETVTLPSGGRLFLPPTRPGASPSSRLPSTRPSFNTHRSRSGSVQRILSAVPAPGLSHSATFLWGQALPIECSSLSLAISGRRLGAQSSGSGRGWQLPKPTAALRCRRSQSPSRRGSGRIQWPALAIPSRARMWLHEKLLAVSSRETGNAIRSEQAAPVAVWLAQTTAG